MFADETRISLIPDTRHQRVWRRKGRGRKSENVQEVYAFGCGSVMFWGGIMFGRRTPLESIPGRLNSQWYVAEVLWPFVQHGARFVFVDDNARAHRGQPAREFMCDINITNMDWPARSPDMNCIEHVWDKLETAFANHPQPPETLPDLI